MSSLSLKVAHVLEGSFYQSSPKYWRWWSTIPLSLQGRCGSHTSLVHVPHLENSLLWLLKWPHQQLPLKFSSSDPECLLEILIKFRFLDPFTVSGTVDLQRNPGSSIFQARKWYWCRWVWETLLWNHVTSSLMKPLRCVSTTKNYTCRNPDMTCQAWTCLYALVHYHTLGLSLAPLGPDSNPHLEYPFKHSLGHLLWIIKS